MKNLAIALLIAVTTPAMGLEVPQKSDRDSRIRYTVYQPDDVVQVDAVVGAAHQHPDDHEDYKLVLKTASWNEPDLFCVEPTL